MLKIFKNRKTLIVISIIIFSLITILTAAIIISSKNNEKINNNNEFNNYKSVNSNSETENIKKNSNINDDKSVSFNRCYDFSNWNKSCSPELIVVNKDNELPENFNTNLEVPSFITINPVTKYLNSIIIPNLQKMFSDANKNNIKLTVSSGYRSISVQQKLFNEKVSSYLKKGYSKSDAEIEASKIVAKPKTSEHNTGLAVDINGVNYNFFKTKEFKWLMENAPNYGFILRYNEDKINITNVIYEPWHFRYVGIEHAKAIVSKNMCLEEYVQYLNNK